MQTRIFEQCQQELKPGTILYRSWGYDQTNINFYVVVRTTKTMAIFQPIEKTIVYRSVNHDETMAMHDLVMPLFSGGKPVIRGTETLRRKVQIYNGEKFLSWANWANAGIVKIWDGETKYQTAFGFGH